MAAFPHARHRADQPGLHAMPAAAGRLGGCRPRFDLDSDTANRTASSELVTNLGAILLSNAPGSHGKARTAPGRSAMSSGQDEEAWGGEEHCPRSRLGAVRCPS